MCMHIHACTWSRWMSVAMLESGAKTKRRGHHSISGITYRVASVALAIPSSLSLGISFSLWFWVSISPVPVTIWEVTVRVGRITSSVADGLVHSSTNWFRTWVTFLGVGHMTGLEM